MQNLKIFTLSEGSTHWDAIVRSFSQYDVYYLSGYVKAFELHGDGTPLLFYYESETLRGIHVVMKRDIAQAPRLLGKVPEHMYFDFSTPYGYGGWIMEGTGDRTAVYVLYQQWCKEHHIISEFVRFTLFSDTRVDYYGQVVQRTHNVVRTLDRPIDEMWMDFEHKVRKNIKKAETYGLLFEVDPNGDCLEDFLDIYYATMDRKNAKDAYYFDQRFYQQINQLNGNYMYFHVLFEKKVIATELILMGSDTMYSYLGGTAGDYFAYRPNDFIKYHIIRWGIENGYKRFVLGGGYGADDGIFRYKRSFAPGGVVPFYTGQMVFDRSLYDWFCTQSMHLDDDSFFPPYRNV